MAPEGLRLVETAPGVSSDEVRAATGAALLPLRPAPHSAPCTLPRTELWPVSNSDLHQSGSTQPAAPGRTAGKQLPSVARPFAYPLWHRPLAAVPNSAALAPSQATVAGNRSIFTPEQ